MAFTKFSFFAAIILCLSLSSCSKKLQYFTQDIYNDFRWSENELQKIQFYLSDDIVLQRRLGSEDSRITKGKIRVIDGSDVEEIIFKKNTPGVIVFTPKTNHFAVSFEENDDNYLMFGPNKKAGGRYVLLAKDWDKHLGKITYNGKTYSTTSESAYASLLVDIKKARNISYKSREASGRKVE